MFSLELVYCKVLNYFIELYCFYKQNTFNVDECYFLCLISVRNNERFVFHFVNNGFINFINIFVIIITCSISISRVMQLYRHVSLGYPNGSTKIYTRVIIVCV